VSNFTLDTSGRAWVTRYASDGAELRVRDLISWHNLDPFTQGYVEALLRVAPEWVRCGAVAGPHEGYCAFSDLSPEALAVILKDCEMVRVMWHGKGQDFWRLRQEGGWPGFPPLTVYLGDDGKVRLREGVA
jgi:hypothetical protein